MIRQMRRSAGTGLIGPQLMDAFVKPALHALGHRILVLAAVKQHRFMLRVEQQPALLA
jgi:hypothetical protein